MYVSSQYTFSVNNKMITRSPGRPRQDRAPCIKENTHFLLNKYVIFFINYVFIVICIVSFGFRKVKWIFLVKTAKGVGCFLCKINTFFDFPSHFGLHFSSPKPHIFLPNFVLKNKIMLEIMAKCGMINMNDNVSCISLCFINTSN